MPAALLMVAYFRLRRVPRITGEPVTHVEIDRDPSTGEVTVTRVWEGIRTPPLQRTLSPDGDG